MELHMVARKQGGIAQATQPRSRVTLPEFNVCFSAKCSCFAAHQFSGIFINFSGRCVGAMPFWEGSKALSLESDPLVPMPSGFYLAGRSMDL